MKYPKDFVDAVKEVYPNSADLHRALDADSEMVGRYLDDSSGGGMMHSNTVVDMIDQGRIEELRAEAAKCVAKRELYGKWLKIYR